MRKNFGIKNNNLVLCLIGSVQKVKGHFLLVESLKEVLKKYNNIQVLIIAGDVGNGYKHSWKGQIKRIFKLPYDNINRMKRMINKNNLNNQFIFLYLVYHFSI